MSKAKLRVLLTIPAMHTFIQEGDFGFYQTLVQILIPEVLRPIPPSLTQAIRNFAKSLESWLTAAMADCPTVISYTYHEKNETYTQYSLGYNNHQTFYCPLFLPNPAPLHLSEPPGPGSQSCAAEPAADQPDAGRPQQGRLCGCAGAGQLGVWV